MIDTHELVEQLRQKAREHRREARRCDAAVDVLLAPQKAQGRPTKTNRDLSEAFRKSGFTYKELAARVGVGYKYISWVVRGIHDKPKLERRIREVLTSEAEAEKGAMTDSAQPPGLHTATKTNAVRH